MALTLTSVTVNPGGEAQLYFSSDSPNPLLTSADLTGFTFTIDGSDYPFSSTTAASQLVSGTHPMSIKAYFDTPIFEDQSVVVSVSGGALEDNASVVISDNAGVTATNTSDLINPGTGVDWYYANQQAVTDAISAAGLQIASNMENAQAAPNTARIQRAGYFADGIMNGRFRSLGFSPIPLSLSDSGDAAILAQISVAIVLVQLSRWRIITTVDPVAMTSRSVLSQFADKNQKYANDMMQDIAQGIIVLSATRVLNAPESNIHACDSRGLPMYPQYPPGFWWGPFGSPTW